MGALRQWTAWISCLLLVYFFRTSLGCSCIFRQPKDIYCSSDFAIAGRVVRQIKTGGTDINEGNKIFTVRVTRDYKGLGWRGRTVELYSPPNDGLCGVSLQNRKKYVIMGTRSSGGVLRINSCQYNQIKRNVPRKVIRGLKKFYKRKCP